MSRKRWEAYRRWDCSCGPRPSPICQEGVSQPWLLVGRQRLEVSSDVTLSPHHTHPTQHTTKARAHKAQQELSRCPLRPFSTHTHTHTHTHSHKHTHTYTR